MTDNWTTIESDPGVFTELIAKFGAKHVQCEEIHSLDAGAFDQLKPVYGLIFLFKYPKEKQTDTRPIVHAPGLFFANQVIENACATQAIVSVLLNCQDQIDIGEELSNFHGFTSSLPPDMRGLALGSSAAIREAHNSFARSEPFVMERDDKQEGGDAFHFITYLPFNGNLYELDGLKEGPVLLGEIGAGQEWTDSIQPHIQERMSRYAQGEIHFNLMAVCKQTKRVFEEKLEELQKQPTSPEVQSQIAQCQASIAAETDKLERWHVQNVRRKHNYIPFVFSLLKSLASKKQLTPLIDAAAEKAKTRAQSQDSAKKD